MGDTLRLSVQEAVAAAQLASDEVKLSAAQVDAADAQVALARANGLPQLRINTSYSHVYENARSTAVNAVFNQPNTYAITASLSQTLFQGGRIVASTRAAVFGRQAVSTNRRHGRVSTSTSSAHISMFCLRGASRKSSEAASRWRRPD
jgi:outer membrane protein TolC